MRHTGPPPQSSTSIDELIASLLRGDRLDRRQIKAVGATAIHDAASAHDVLPMVADRLALAPELPDDLREIFLEELHRFTVVDLACASRGPQPRQTLSGRALSHGHHSQASWRRCAGS